MVYSTQKSTIPCVQKPGDGESEGGFVRLHRENYIWGVFYGLLWIVLSPSMCCSHQQKQQRVVVKPHRLLCEHTQGSLVQLGGGWFCISPRCTFTFCAAWLLFMWPQTTLGIHERSCGVPRELSALPHRAFSYPFITSGVLHQALGGVDAFLSKCILFPSSRERPE
jgi:hypothetical protein